MDFSILDIMAVSASIPPAVGIVVFFGHSMGDLQRGMFHLAIIDAFFQLFCAALLLGLWAGVLGLKRWLKWT